MSQLRRREGNGVAVSQLFPRVGVGWQTEKKGERVIGTCLPCAPPAQKVLGLTLVRTQPREALCLPRTPSLGRPPRIVDTQTPVQWNLEGVSVCPGEVGWQRPCSRQ